MALLVSSSRRRGSWGFVGEHCVHGVNVCGCRRAHSCWGRGLALLNVTNILAQRRVGAGCALVLLNGTQTALAQRRVVTG